MKFPRPFRRLIIASFRHRQRVKLRSMGYSRSQARRLAGKLQDATIWDSILQFMEAHPVLVAIIKAVIALLPLLLAAEKPEGVPMTESEAEADVLSDAEENPAGESGPDPATLAV